jgi:hypothetical protein
MKQSASGAGASTIFLFSCVSVKRTGPAPAKDLYISEWFRRARALVESTGCGWFILSARFGLVSPEDIIAPYEQTLNRMRVDDRRAWADSVRQQLGKALPAGTHCVVLAGHRYREFLMQDLREQYSVEVPMAGLRIGEQLRWLGGHAGGA